MVLKKGVTILSVMLSLELMAVATNNIVGQKAISESKNPKVLKALSRNPHLCGEVANILAKSRDLSISVPALRKADDTDLLEKSLKRGVNRARAVYRNLNLPEYLLIDDRYAYDNGAVLARCINPNTPLDWRKKILTPETTERLVEVGEPVMKSAVRGFEVALNNSWMLDTPSAWSNHMRRGLAGLPNISLEQYRELETEGVRWSERGKHPVAQGLDIYSMRVESLLALGHPAADIYLLNRGDLTEGWAGLMVEVRGGSNPAPHIMGRCVSRFGVGVLRKIMDRGVAQLAVTRVGSAEFSEPAISYLWGIDEEEVLNVESAESVLLDNDGAWEYFVQLMDIGERDVYQTARAAVGLERAGRN